MFTTSEHRSQFSGDALASPSKSVPRGTFRSPTKPFVGAYPGVHPG